jgi:3-oxoacyl-[acyl-carrier-protein] synthase-3
MFGNLIQDAMRVCELKPEDVTLIVPHQVNRRIVDSAMEKINLPLEMAYLNIEKYGNTSSASIPMALDEAIRVGRLKQGQIAIFVAFGAGLTWGNAVVRM